MPIRVKLILNFEFFVYFFQTTRHSYRVFNSESEKIIGQWNPYLENIVSMNPLQVFGGFSCSYQDKTETFF